jgi:hypothetical protein
LRILAISSSLNGSVGGVVTFGGFTPFAGFSSSHFDDTQNERNARSRSSFLWAEIAPSFQLARNSRTSWIVSDRTNLDVKVLPELFEVGEEHPALRERGVREMAGFRVGRELRDSSRDRDEFGTDALGFPLAEKRLASLPGADVQGLPDEGSAEGSLERERAAAGPVVTSLGPVPAIPQMAAEEVEHTKVSHA